MKIMNVDNIATVKILLWDTAGHEKYRSVVKYHYTADAILVVFDITNLQSFQNVSRWMQDINDNAMENVLIILIGNKNDLNDKRQVSFAEAKSYSDKLGINYYETSAKDDTSVEKMFEQIIRGTIRFTSFHKENEESQTSYQKKDKLINKLITSKKKSRFNTITVPSKERHELKPKLLKNIKEVQKPVKQKQEKKKTLKIKVYKPVKQLKQTLKKNKKKDKKSLKKLNSVENERQSDFEEIYVVPRQ